MTFGDQPFRSFLHLVTSISQQKNEMGQNKPCFTVPPPFFAVANGFFLHQFL